jgi:S-adenosyl-L-methionine hydrolase (adenosine-forming)
MAIVTLLSDYGVTDGYVAEIKAVLLHSLFPPHLVDITHQVPVFDVRHAAFQLWRTYGFFPEGTWHLALVEPAGSRVRSGVYVRTKQYHFVGPDNGILKWAVEAAEQRDGQAAQVFKLPIQNRLEPGYWGRDSYAAFVRDHLNGASGKLKSAAQLQGECFPKVQHAASGAVQAEVITSDVFGNVILSLPLRGFEKGRGQLKDAGFLECYRDYAELPESGVGLIPGSNGLWEISARNASAAERTGARPGDLFTWYP